MKTTEVTVAKVNKVDITIIQNGEKRVAIKPICQALGIDYKSQYERIKKDEILGSTMVLSTTVGADGRQREMASIPLMYVFGWLFRIDARNVAAHAQESVLRYQIECYTALYNYFTRHEEFLEFRQTEIDKHLAEYDAARTDFRLSKEKVNEARKQLDEARSITEADYFESKRQMVMSFPAEEGKETENE
jgi:hypothetical protein